MTPRPCPQCGAPLDVQRGVEMEEPYFPTHPMRDAPLPRRRRVVTAEFCGACEYAAEVSNR